jgi:hypothetical protein
MRTSLRVLAARPKNRSDNANFRLQVSMPPRWQSARRRPSFAALLKPGRVGPASVEAERGLRLVLRPQAAQHARQELVRRVLGPRAGRLRAYRSDRRPGNKPSSRIRRRPKCRWEPCSGRTKSAAVLYNPFSLPPDSRSDMIRAETNVHVWTTARRNHTQESPRAAARRGGSASLRRPGGPIRIRRRFRRAVCRRASPSRLRRPRPRRRRR